MQDYVERDDTDFGQQLHDHGQALDIHGAALGFSAGEITGAKEDAKLFLYLLGRQSVTQAYAQELTKFKNLARKGSGNEVLPAAIPEHPANPIPLPVVTGAKIEARFRQRAAKAKAHATYTTGIGEALRIEKPLTVFDPNSGTPVFKIELNFGGHPHITFKKGHWQGVEIWKIGIEPELPPAPPGPVQPDDPGFKKLERVFGHDYVDPSPLPTFGQSKVWVYKMIYLDHDQPVGNWSALIYVTVGGM